MRTRLAGFQDIPSAIKHGLGSIPGRMQPQSEYEILNKMTLLSQEKELLGKQRENWQRKIDRIDARLKDIERLKESLEQQLAMMKETSSDAHEAESTKHEMIVRY